MSYVICEFHVHWVEIISPDRMKRKRNLALVAAVSRIFLGEMDLGKWTSRDDGKKSSQAVGSWHYFLPNPYKYFVISTHIPFDNGSFLWYISIHAPMQSKVFRVSLPLHAHSCYMIPIRKKDIVFDTGD